MRQTIFERSSSSKFVKKEGENRSTMQVFAGLTDDKPVVLGSTKNIIRSRSVYL